MGLLIPVASLAITCPEPEADLLIGVSPERQKVEWFIQLGEVYLNTRNYEDAVNLNTAALRVNNREPRYYHNRGVAYIQLSRLDEAIADLAKAVELKPDYALAFRNAGLAYYSRAYDKAVTVLSKAIELSPRDDQAYSWRAACRAALGDRAGCASDRRKAANLKSRQQQVVEIQPGGRDHTTSRQGGRRRKRGTCPSSRPGSPHMMPVLR
jgi:tetratricopeptide (TPR) repeat protein